MQMPKIWRQSMHTAHVFNAQASPLRHARSATVKQKTIRHVLLALCVIGLINLASVVAFNLLMVPRGIHMVAALTDQTRPFKDRDWVDHLTFKPLSWLIFRYHGNYCDLPMYEKDKTLNPGHNLTLHTLIGLYEDGDGRYPELKHRVRQEIEYAASRCDVNAQPTPQDLTPFQSTILWADPDLFASLLRHGGDLNLRINRPGKQSDQLTPLAFAELLEQRIPRQAAEFRQIQALIRAQPASAPVRTQP